MNRDIEDGLKPMFEIAEEKGLWFFSMYQNLWFSPEDLKEKQANGKFRWGATNWVLRDPQSRVEELRRTVKSAQAELAEFTDRLNSYYNADN